MTTYSQREIESLIERFEAEKLPKAEWTHEAHLVVAIWYCSKFDFNEALPLVRENITKHNTSLGTPNTDYEGYHETITKFWLLIVNDFIRLQKSGTVSRLCNDFIQSPYGKSSYPLEFYSTERLFSVEARQHWLEPDLKEISLIN